MPLYIKDPEVDRLAERLAMLRRVSKTDAVRHALQRELEMEEAVPSLVERGVEFVRDLRARGSAAPPHKAGKTRKDSLHGKN